ncbi:MAG TPA: DUF3617 domain-containing protein [Thioalkalivibrio sp.]|nr:DUF3617 domain-containing protein [Thioalkalivibrio sp.]
MHIRHALVALLAGLISLPALAVEPNIEPGQWEYTNVTTFEGVPMPDQTHSAQECVTAEDIKKGEAFLEEAEECQVTNMDMRRDGMTYTMVCTQQGMEMHMDADMRFGGDTVNGTMRTRMDTPMGPMNMNMKIQGRRIGDC